MSRKKDSQSTVLSVGSAVVSDALSVFSIPGGALLSLAASEYIKKRQEEARDTIIEEISRGDVSFSQSDKDPLIHATLRINRAVMDGATKKTLRLLSRAIVGLKMRDDLTEDHLSKWENILLDLSDDEIAAIGLAARTKYANKTEFWQKFQEYMKDSGYDMDAIHSISIALSRHGLMISLPVYSGIAHAPTNRLLELVEIARLNTDDDQELRTATSSSPHQQSHL